MTGLQQSPLAPPAAPPALGELTRLFRALHAADIRYCHWKSNQHLRASMLGETDLDVLVDRHDGRALTQVLGQTSFRHFNTLPRRSYPAVESYLGLDSETGRLIHLHLHYQLTLGEMHLKGYHLPWEEVLLATRVMTEDEEVYVADPHLEFVLLVVRAALKLRLRDLVSAGLGRPHVRGNALREFRWLAARLDPQRLERLASDLLGRRAAALLAEMAAGRPPSVSQLLRLIRLAEPSLSEYRTYAAGIARLRRWSREGRRHLAEAARRYLGALVATRRQPPAGGLIVAFVGPDGSGKSTLAREISHWLSGLVDVVPIYFGSGQGPASFSRRMLEGVASLARRPAQASVTTALPRKRGSGSSILRTAGELLWVWSLARERRGRATRARRARNRGMIVLCDRFPSQTVGMDGPCLGHWMDHPSWAKRTVAREELAAIQQAQRLHPDLIIKLNVPLDVALRRKPDTPPALLREKLRALADLRAGTGARVLEVDATRPFEEVVLEAKLAVWSSL